MNTIRKTMLGFAANNEWNRQGQLGIRDEAQCDYYAQKFVYGLDIENPDYWMTFYHWAKLGEYVKQKREDEF